jgi:uncharacterized GH25 family protein
MRSRLSKPCWILLVSTLAAPVLAHDTWLLPRSTAIASGGTVTLELTSGMVFPKNETAIKPDRVARAGVRLAGETSVLEDRRSAAKSLELSARLTRPGVATLWIELAPKSIDLKPEEVAHYLDEIGASQEVRRAWAEMPKPRRWRELYVKHAKAFVRVGDPEGDRSWAEPVGLGLEIVPEQDPVALRPGDDLSVQVLRGGEPLASFPLALAPEGKGKAVVKTTDAQGRATFRLDRAGRWLMRGTHLRRSTKTEADWESDFTTMTLEVR